ncbi:uncharacterized protein BKCO1_7800040 [Diplodia corticola]|uniref:Uncharacterized protein n=1 Tax=Diplodia corticola TaxID=236234 RepID=A0A1J9RPS2_9PEZI|nr:uncharacterized protein BKCO1_7800040 [Diplodia corticola]OJD29557.1 hypothetical protein BKCO1_7800040 [Diplodia corticola]
MNRSAGTGPLGLRGPPRMSCGTSRYYYTTSPFTYTSSRGGEEQQEEEDEETERKRKEPCIPAFPVILIGLIAASAIDLGAMHEEKPTTAPGDPQQQAASLTTTITRNPSITTATETVTVTAKDCPISPTDFDWVWICDEASRRRAFPTIDSDNDAEDFAHLSVHDMKLKKAQRGSKAIMRALRGYARGGLALSKSAAANIVNASNLLVSIAPIAAGAAIANARLLRYRTFVGSLVFVDETRRGAKE